MGKHQILVIFFLKLVFCDIIDTGLFTLDLLFPFPMGISKNSPNPSVSFLVYTHLIKYRLQRKDVTQYNCLERKR